MSSLDEAKAARRRREKPQLSCNLCRSRKLRCDRQQPCQNCSRRGLSDSCLYASANTSPSTHSHRPQQVPAHNVQNRVRQLESQVDLLMGSMRHELSPAQEKSLQVQTQTDQFESSIPATSTPGYLECLPSSTNYVGGAHWLSILENIPELKDILDECTQTLPSNHLTSGGISESSDLLSGCFQKIDREEILNAVPSKAVVDTLLAEFFTNTDNESMIVHAPTFRREYTQFWDDPDQVPLMWIGLLFAFMCLAVQYQQFSQNESRRLQSADSDPESLVETFRQKTIQCLVLGRYIDGPPHAVETLLLYFFIEVLRGDNTETPSSTWVIWGNIVRISLRSGYHRDGSHFASMSPFQAEVRRRVWAIIIQWDILISLQFSLPRLVRPSQCDTADPRNLADEDLYDAMPGLPPARPDSARTVPQYHVAKNRLLSVVAMIYDLTSSAAPSPAAEISRLDELLTSTYSSILPVWQPDGQSTKTPLTPTVSVRSTFLTLIYHRAQIVLHQHYLQLDRTNGGHGHGYGYAYTYSRKTCIDAALTILQHQWTLYLQTQVGGPLCRHGWKFLSLLAQDFLYATAVLCAELAQDLNATVPGADPSLAQDSNAIRTGDGVDPSLTSSLGPGSGSDGNTRDRVFHSLSSAYIVWLQSNDSDSSRAVKSIVAALRVLIDRAQSAGFVPQTQSSAMRDQKPGTEWAHSSVRAAYHGLANFPV